MFDRFLNVNQQQLILLLGIIIIILLLIDAYRRVKRKKFQVSIRDSHQEFNNVVEKKSKNETILSKTLSEDKDAEVIFEKELANDIQEETVEYQFEAIDESSDNDIQEEVLTDSEEEPKTWQEALELKRQQHIQKNRHHQGPEKK